MGRKHDITEEEGSVTVNIEKRLFLSLDQDKHEMLCYGSRHPRYITKISSIVQRFLWYSTLVTLLSHWLTAVHIPDSLCRSRFRLKVSISGLFIGLAMRIVVRVIRPGSTTSVRETILITSIQGFLSCAVASGIHVEGSTTYHITRLTTSQPIGGGAACRGC